MVGRNPHPFGLGSRMAEVACHHHLWDVCRCSGRKIGRRVFTQGFQDENVMINKISKASIAQKETHVDILHHRYWSNIPTLRYQSCALEKSKWKKSTNAFIMFREASTLRYDLYAPQVQQTLPLCTILPPIPYIKFCFVIHVHLFRLNAPKSKTRFTTT